MLDIIKKLSLLIFVLLLCLTSVFALYDDAEAYWSLDNADLSGSNPLDSSGNGHTLTTNTVTTGATGVLGEAFNFTYAGYTRATSNLLNSENWTINFWVKPNNTATIGRPFHQGDGDNNPHTSLYILSNVWTGRTRVTSYYDVNSYNPTTNWEMITITYQHGSYKIYRNGVLNATSTVGYSTAWSSYFCIGARCTAAGGDQFFGGLIDEFGIWHYEADQTMVDTLYNSGSGYNPYTTPNPYFTVTAKDDVSLATLSNISVVLDNGTIYRNYNTFVQLPFNDSRLLNFTVKLMGNSNNSYYEQSTNTIYFNRTYVNYNTSANLQSNHTQYPYMNITDSWSKVPLQLHYMFVSPTFSPCYSVSTIFGTCKRGIFKNNLNYLPINTTTKTYTLAGVDNYLQHPDFSHSFQNQNDLNISFWQSEIKFIATQIITGSVVTGAQFTINGVTKNSGDIFNLSAGSYNVTFSHPSYFNKSYGFTVSIGDQKTVTVQDVSGSVIDLRVKEFYLNTSITSFNVTVTQASLGYTETYTNQNSAVNLSILQNYPFILDIRANGFIAQNITINSTVTQYNQTAYLYRDNELYIYFYDEQTLLPITNVNYSVFSLNSVGFGIELNNTNGNNYAFIQDLPSSLYTIEYKKTNYTTRNYIINIPFGNSSETNVSMYLLSSSDSASFVAKTTDRNNRPLSDVYGSLLRRYVIDGQTVYKVVDMFSPSVSLSGAAPFTAVPNTVAYLFRIQNYNGDILYQGAASNSQGYETFNLIDSELFIKVQTTGNAFDVYQDLNGFSFLLTNTTSNTFWLSWSDTQDAISQICLDVKANNTVTLTTSSIYCTTDASGVLSYTFTPSNSTYYVARAKVITSSNSDQLTVAIKTLNYDIINKETSDIFGYLGIFMLVVSLIICAIALANNPPVAVITAVLCIIAFSPTALGLVYIGNVMQGTMLVLAIVIAFLTGGDR